MWKGVDASMVVEYANNMIGEIFGVAALSSIQAMYYKNEVLAIACLSSTAAQAVRLNEQAIISKIEQRFGVGKVKKIRYLA